MEHFRWRCSVGLGAFGVLGSPCGCWGLRCTSLNVGQRRIPPAGCLGVPLASRGSHGTSWGSLGASWKYLWVVLRFPWGVLGSRGALLGVPGWSWGHLGASREQRSTTQNEHVSKYIRVYVVVDCHWKQQQRNGNTKRTRKPNRLKNMVCFMFVGEGRGHQQKQKGEFIEQKCYVVRFCES
jgi:hypothetical protein